MKKYAILLLTLLALTMCESDDPIQFKLSTQVNPPEGGTISPSSGTFDEGEEITFTATAAEEYVFKNWTDDASGDENPMTVVMADDMFVTANFEKRTYPLTIEIQGEGTVKEEIVPGKSTTDYPSGTTVQLTAVPEDEWEFVKWEGSTSLEENPMVITITEPTTWTAIFQKVSYALTVEIEGEGTVKEEVIAAKSSTDYPSGTTVQLTAIPEDGWVFMEWTGDHQGNENPLEIKVDKPFSLTAIFKSVIAQEKVYVPDDNFEQALIGLSLDDKLDDYVYSEWINNVEELRLEGRQIQDLTGIAGFEKLKILVVSNNQIQKLDISQNLRLEQLICDRNQLTSLDISQNMQLVALVATENQLSCIQVSAYQLYWINWVGGPAAPWFAFDEGVLLSTDCSITNEQRTYVPDDGLEQALIDLGRDDVLDDYVKTINIVNLSALDVSGKNISDLTGMEDFSGLLLLNASNNDLTALDISEWGVLISLDLTNNPLTCLQINEDQQMTIGGLMLVYTDEGVAISLDCGY